MFAGKVEQDPDDFVLHEAKPLGAKPALALLQQQLLGGDAAFHQRQLKPLGHGRAELAVAPFILAGKLIQRGGNAYRVEDIAVLAGLVKHASG